MKSKIIAVILTGMMLMPTVAYAKDQKENSKGKSEIHTQFQRKTVKIEDKSNKLEDKSKIAENKCEKLEVKVLSTATEAQKIELKAKHEIMKANTEKSISLKKQITTKKQELTSILSDIKSGKRILSADQLTLLTSKAAALKKTSENIKNLPEVCSDATKTKEILKGQNFETAIACLNMVIAKQEVRYAKLVELNANMDELLAIARQAQVVTIPTTTPAAISIQ